MAEGKSRQTMVGTEGAPRSIAHPGSSLPQRISSAEGQISRCSIRLANGRNVNDAVTGALAEAGFRSGYVHLENVSLAPLKFVIPAPSPDDSHAAWYSETLAPAGIASIEQAGLIVGMRDGVPFTHCHGVWRQADGTRRMGHLLPFDSILAEDTQAEAWGICGALFEVQDDPETNFRLFAPEARAGSPERRGSRGFLCTVRPNEDITRAVESACRQHGIHNAQIRGIGSLVGADFADGTHVDSYATEVLITRGELRPTEAGPQCILDIALVDMDGAIAEGRLAEHGNPVCVTFELLVEERLP